MERVLEGERSRGTAGRIGASQILYVERDDRSRRSVLGPGCRRENESCVEMDSLAPQAVHPMGRYATRRGGEYGVERRSAEVAITGWCRDVRDDPAGRRTDAAAEGPWAKHGEQRDQDQSPDDQTMRLHR